MSFELYVILKLFLKSTPLKWPRKYKTKAETTKSHTKQDATKR